METTSSTIEQLLPEQQRVLDMLQEAGGETSNLDQLLQAAFRKNRMGLGEFIAHLRLSLTCHADNDFLRNLQLATIRDILDEVGRIRCAIDQGMED